MRAGGAIGLRTFRSSSPFVAEGALCFLRGNVLLVRLETNEAHLFRPIHYDSP
jgi:hypothetical protein